MSGVNRRCHHWPVRVYYEDTDFSGVVYHAGYLRFMERGRTEMLRDAGVDQAGLHGQGLAFAVSQMTIAFKAPARMDDVLAVDTSVDALGGASITLQQRVRRDARILVEASVRVALVSGGRPMRLPRDVAAKLTRWWTGPSSP